MFSSGKPSNNKSMFTKFISEADVLGFYLGIKSIPCLMLSPFRKDSKPSLAFYSPNGTNVNYMDFGTREGGTIVTFFMKLWNLDYNKTIDKIVNEAALKHSVVCNKSIKGNKPVTVRTKNVELQCKIRDWQDYDIKYWESYGISLEWLKWAEVYPISHKIIIKDNKKMVFGAEKYAYTFVERKDGRITHKFYQPFNTNGYKWQNNHDKSVLGLWTKMPEKGKSVCICSSVKDALCLMSNLNIPCICLQGEGYPISDAAIKELKRRFTDVFILLDNDETGLKDAEKLAESTGFINVVIPPFEGGKDVSDFYKAKGKETFKTIFKNLFIEARYNWYNELPF